MRELLMFALGKSETFEGYVEADGHRYYPCAKGFRYFFVLCFGVAVALFLTSATLREFWFAIPPFGLLVAIIISFPLARLNWEMFKRRYPESVVTNALFIHGPTEYIKEK